MSICILKKILMSFFFLFVFFHYHLVSLNPLPHPCNQHTGVPVEKGVSAFLKNPPQLHIGAATLENSMAVPQKIKNITTL